MEKDRERWNRKYKEGEYLLKEPSDIVKRFIHLAPKGRALDIACGLGRNSIYLAQHGYKVDAIDISDVALEKLKGIPNINPIQADLDNYQLPENAYSLIININYLNRNLFPQIKESLIEGGLLIFETFTLNRGKEFSQPENKSYLLRRNELLSSFSDMYVIYYQEREIIRPDKKKAFISSLVAKKECTL